jgi:hypothetical protein
MLSSLLGVDTSSAGLQPGGCVQPSQEGCPLTFDQPQSAVLDDPSTQHVWTMSVSGAGPFQMTLSLPSVYRFYVYGPDGELLGPFDGNDGEASLEIQPSHAGFYSVVVDSPGGQVSNDAYVIVAVRIGGPPESPATAATSAPDAPTATTAPEAPPSTGVSDALPPPVAPDVPPPTVPASTAAATATDPARLGSAEGAGLRVTVISVQRPYQGRLPPSGSEYVLIRVRIDNISSNNIALPSWRNVMKVVDAQGATRSSMSGAPPESLGTGTMVPGSSKEGNTLFLLPVGTPTLVSVVWEMGTQRIVVPLR